MHGSDLAADDRRHVTIVPLVFADGTKGASCYLLTGNTDKEVPEIDRIGQRPGEMVIYTPKGYVECNGLDWHDTMCVQVHESGNMVQQVLFIPQDGAQPQADCAHQGGDDSRILPGGDMDDCVAGSSSNSHLRQ